MSPSFKTVAKKWFTLFWYAAFFFLACFYMSKGQGWDRAFWLVSGMLFYNKASAAFKDL